MDWFHLREPVSAWSHAVGLLLALPATAILLHHTRSNRLKQLGFLIYGITLAACYAGSTLYHGARVSPDWLRWFATLDYIGIYLLIAGSITPVALIVLERRWRLGMLVLSWLLAALGIGLRLSLSDLPLPVATAFYLAMGWAVLACYFELARALPPRAMNGPLLSGLLYSTGAFLNVAHWPVLWPGIVGPHEVFHLFVLGGSTAHFLFVLTVVAPFERPAVRPLPAPASLVPAA
jgi:hemolysin III